MVTIIADDLTGAVDTGAVFVPFGRTLVFTNGWVYKVSPNVRVQSLNTSTRHELPSQIFSQMRSKVGPLPLTGQIFKKVDSTLRGNIGAEIEAALKVTHKNHAVLCSANPSNNRTIIHGKLLVDDQPLERSAMAADPKNPMIQGEISKIISHTSGIPASKIDLVDVQNGFPHFKRLLKTTPRTSRHIYIVDAKTNDDLMRLATLIAEYPHVLPVGSSGLARALAPMWLHGRADVCLDLPFVDQLIAVVGSKHINSRNQIEEQAKSLHWPVVEFGHVRDPCKEVGEKIDNLIVTLNPNPLANPDDLIARMVECVTKRLSLVSTSTMAILASGGDTALALVEGLGIEQFQIIGEFQPGVVASQAQYGADHITIITKSGSFGSLTFFEELWAWLTQPHVI
jgi:uncharacterized protein YgbK (DUF1537 family)